MNVWSAARMQGRPLVQTESPRGQDFILQLGTMSRGCQWGGSGIMTNARIGKTLGIRIRKPESAPKHGAVLLNSSAETYKRRDMSGSRPSRKRHDPVTLFQRHRAPIFKKIIFTELADSGQALCFYVAPYPKLGTFLQKLGEGKGWKFAIAIVTRAVHFLTLQDSRPHVLFGTVLVKHLLDLISSFPQSVQFL